MRALSFQYSVLVISALFWISAAHGQSGGPDCARESIISSDLKIEIIRYENPNLALVNGEPCSIVSLSPTNKKLKCNAVFRFEVIRESNDGLKNLNYRQTNEYKIGDTPPDKKFIEFNGTIGAMRNPIVCEVRMNDLKHIFLKVTVEHDERSGEQKQLMDIFVLMLEPLRTQQNRTLTGSTADRTLQVNYQFKCKANQYGPLCENKCVPYNDDNNGHYRCSADGDKVCLDGWTNVDSDCKVPEWCIWC